MYVPPTQLVNECQHPLGGSSSEMSSSVSPVTLTVFTVWIEMVSSEFSAFSFVFHAFDEALALLAGLKNKTMFENHLKILLEN